jgi:hypothetical protein
MTTTLATTAHELPARSLGPGLLAVTLALYCAGCGTSPVVLSASRTDNRRKSIAPGIPWSGWILRAASLN